MMRHFKTLPYTFLLPFVILPGCVTLCVTGCGPSDTVQQSSPGAKLIADTNTAQAAGRGVVPADATPFPSMGKTTADFVPQEYEVDLEAEGLLDNDKLADQVLVLRRKNEPAAARTCLVLLQQAGGGYRLAAVSDKAIKPAETADGYPVYDSEDISIKDHNLLFDLYSAGPEGNLNTVYRYEETGLVLTNISTYNMGAGSHTEVTYNLDNGQYEQTVTNTMIDSMPSETTTRKYVQPKILFEDADPLRIIYTAYDKTHVN